MATRQQAKEALNRKLGQRRENTPTRTAFLGNGLGTDSSNLYVDGQTDLVYARESLAVGADFFVTYNRTVNPAINMPVILGYPNAERAQEQVLSVNYDGLPQGAGQTIGSWGLKQHGDSHGFQGGDTVYIDGRQFIPGLVKPQSTPSMLVDINNFFYYYKSLQEFQAVNNIDLSSYVPSSQSVFVVIVVIPEINDLAFRVGQPFTPEASLADLIEDVGTDSLGGLINYMPTLGADEYPLAAILLRSTTTQIEWSNDPNVNNIWDLRYHMAPPNRELFQRVEAIEGLLGNSVWLTSAGAESLSSDEFDGSGGGGGSGSFVLKAGDTMTGYLTLNADPTSNLHAATKQYVDAAVGDYVLVAGDSMTGDLTMTSGGRVLIVDGSESVPAFAFASDEDIGFYYDNTGISTSIAGSRVSNIDGSRLKLWNEFRQDLTLTPSGSQPEYNIREVTISSSTHTSNATLSEEIFNLDNASDSDTWTPKLYRVNHDGGNNDDVSVFQVTYANNGQSSGISNVNVFVANANNTYPISGSAITDLTGFRVSSFSNTSGTITNAYAIYLEDQSDATNNFGIYQEGSDVVNYFQGRLAVGTDSPNDVGLTIARGTSPISLLSPNDVEGMMISIRGSDSPTSMRGFRIDGYLEDTVETVTSYQGVVSVLRWGGSADFTSGSASNPLIRSINGVIRVQSDESLSHGTAIQALAQVQPSYTPTITDFSAIHIAPLDPDEAVITNMYGVKVSTPVASNGSGSVTNIYGIHLDNISTGTNNYGIYQVGSGAVNYFGGSVGVGTDSPSTVLHVNSGATNLNTTFESTDAFCIIDIKDNSGTASIGNSGTSLAFSADSGLSGIRYLDLTSTTTIFNNGGEDIDFRVESDTNQYMLFIDASEDAIAIGTSTATSGYVTIDHSHSESSPKNTLKIDESWSPTSTSGSVFPVGIAVNIAYDTTHSPSGGFATANRSFARVINTGAINLRNIDVYSQNTDTAALTFIQDIFIRTPANSGGGSVTTYTALTISNSTIASTNYGLVQKGGSMLNYFQGDVHIGATSSGNSALTVSDHITPKTDNTYDLGTGSYRWDDVYATNGTIQTSDRRNKRDILDTSLGLSFIKSLRPVEYKFKNKTVLEDDVELLYTDDDDTPVYGNVQVETVYEHNRPHQGLIAQEVLEVMKNQGIEDFAGFIIDENGTYGLRYAEFIAPMIKAIQEQQEIIEAMQQQINELKG